MHKLLSTKWTYYEDFYKKRKEYESQGIDNCYVPNEEWMDEIGNEYFLIWSPQTKRRSRMEVVKGKISRGEYGVPKVYGTYLDKPNKSIGWDGYFPRYCWGTAHEFMGIEMTEENKLGCLVFDNEQEARDFCDRYNDWKEGKIRKEIDEYLHSEKSVKSHTERLKQIKKLVDSLSESDVSTYTTIDGVYEAIGNKLGWKDYIY